MPTVLEIQRCTATMQGALAPLGELVSYSCTPCGWETPWWPVRHDQVARGEVREHLRRWHADVLEFGPCAECGSVTDHLRVDSELGRSWLCPRHSSSMSVADVAEFL